MLLHACNRPKGKRVNTTSSSDEL